MLGWDTDISQMCCRNDGKVGSVRISVMDCDGRLTSIGVGGHDRVEAYSSKSTVFFDDRMEYSQ